MHIDRNPPANRLLTSFAIVDLGENRLGVSEQADELQRACVIPIEINENQLSVLAEDQAALNDLLEYEANLQSGSLCADDRKPVDIITASLAQAGMTSFTVLHHCCRAPAIQFKAP